MLTNEILLIGSCFVGLIAGIVVAALFGKKRLEAEREKGQAIQAQFDEEKQKSSALQTDIQAQLQKGAKLEEQVAQLPKLEEKLSAAMGRLETTTKELADLRQQHGAAESTIEARDAQIERNRTTLCKLQDELAKAQLESKDLKASLATSETELEAERKQGKEKLALLEEAKEDLSNKFKSLANDILDEKSKRFTDQNQNNIKQILDPLKTKIVEFQDQVEKAYHQEGKDRSELAAQVKQLMGLNKQLSDDAHNFTSALKGQSKTRGDWGELILERVLETSGLSKDHEYTVQESHTREDGTRVQPDVVVHLPDDKHLVIDSKVSLTAYLQYTEAEDDAQRNIASKGHLNSIKAHIKGLSGKNYQDLYGIKSPDFVIMFIPIEPAFALAISNDIALWQEAWNKNVLVVSPSALLFVIRTVAHIWRQEKQNQNAQEIADRGGRLYDKFKGFVDDLEKVGDRIRQTQDSYEKARGKLYAGSGNLIRQAEMLKELGVKPKRSINQELIEEASDGEPSLMIESNQEKAV